MPLQFLQFRPGVSRESTNLANQGGWYDCDKIRFKSGLPQKLGGWVPYTAATGATAGGFLGTARNLTEAVSLTGYYMLGVGTNLKYYILVGSQYFDITPIRAITGSYPAVGYPSALGSNPFYPIYSTLTASISATDTTIPITSATSFTYVDPYVITIGSEQIYVPTVSGSNLLGCVRGYNGTTAATHTSGTVVSSSYLVLNSPGNGAQVGDFVTFTGATAFGPYSASVLNDEYQILAQNNTYIAVDIGVQSTSASNGGGTVVVASYQLTTGADINVVGNGWGTGVWIGPAPLAGVSSTLSSAITTSSTTIPLVSAASFSAGGGQAVIGSLTTYGEIITYTGKAGNSLTGVTRGVACGIAPASSGTVVQGISTTAVGGTNRAWNTGYSGSGATGFRQTLRLWSADNYGSDFVLNPRGDSVYYWQTETYLNASGYVVGTVGNPDGRAVNILNLAGADGYAPAVGNFVLVSDQGYIVVLGGVSDPVTPNTTQDPMIVQWCSQGNPLVWDPSDVTNTAGYQRLNYGSKIVCGEQTRQEILVFTDTAVYSMQYLGAPYIFGFNPISVETTIVSSNCVATANNITYWMGQDKFYVYSGRVDTLPCSLRQYIFDDFNFSQQDQVMAGTNEKYNEVWWFYCSNESTIIDRYVIYNYLERLWYYGTLSRTAWLDSHIIGNPLGTSLGYMYQHETGLDDGSTNPPTAFHSYIESADFDIGDGDKFSFIKRVVPDIDFIGSTSTTPSVSMTIAARDFPGQALEQQSNDAPVDGVPIVTPINSASTAQVFNYNNQVWIRLRGRQVSFRIESGTVSTDTGVAWQLGTPRLDLQPDGRRGAM